MDTDGVRNGKKNLGILEKQNVCVRRLQINMLEYSLYVADRLSKICVGWGHFLKKRGPVNMVRVHFGGCLKI